MHLAYVINWPDIEKIDISPNDDDWSSAFVLSDPRAFYSAVKYYSITFSMFANMIHPSYFFLYNKID